jgi:hypothetical protein
MAEVSKAPKGRREPRSPKPDAERDPYIRACKERWENPPVDEETGQAPPKISTPFSKLVQAPDGKKIAAGLLQFYQVTGDPLFKEAALALAAYGLASGSPQNSAKRLWENSSIERMLATNLMSNHMAEAKDKGKRLSVNKAAAKVVAQLRLGSCFETEVKRLREFYADCLKGRCFPSFEQSPGEIGTILVGPVEGREPEEAFARRLPKEGKEVPNNRQWRKIVARGDVTARVIGCRELPPEKGNT